MKRLSVPLLALGLAAAFGTASAQNYGAYQNGAQDGDSNTAAIYDYARVLRVDPVLDTRYGNSGRYGNTYASNGQRCYESTGRYATNGYSNGSYPNDPNDPQRQGQYGTQTGRTMATVVGGIAGAVLGSKVGGGTGAYAATAIGSMVGGMAGRQIYDSSQRRRYENNTVTVCDDGGYNSGYASNGNYVAGNDARVVGYDVTYEYMGRQFRTRTDHHPGDRIRVRVDVHPE